MGKREKKKTQQNNGHALIGEKEFPLLLKSPLTITRGCNVFFYFDFILHQWDEVAESECSFI